MSHRSTKAATVLFSLSLLACAIAIPLTTLSRTGHTPDVALAAITTDAVHDAHAAVEPNATSGDWTDWQSSEDTSGEFGFDDRMGDGAPYDPLMDGEELSPPQQRGRGQGRGGRGGRGGGPRGVYRASVNATWFANSPKFWYRNNLADNKSEYILVDAEKGVRGPAFDHAKLAIALQNAAEQRDISADALPFAAIEDQPLLKFNDDATEVSFFYNGGQWLCKMGDTYTCTRTGDAPAAPAANAQTAEDDEPQQGRRGGRGGRGGGQGGRGGRGGRGGGGGGPVRSPNEQWTAETRGGNIVVRTAGQPAGEPVQLTTDGTEENGYRQLSWSPDSKLIGAIRGGNIFIRPSSAGGETVKLTTDGTEEIGYGRLSWSPDSKNLVAFRSEPGDGLEVHLIASSPEAGGRAIYTHRPYPLPGDKFASHELSLFDIDAKKQTKPPVDKIDFNQPNIRWDEGGQTFTYQKVDRGHQRFRLIRVNAKTGEASNIIDEPSKTFVWTAHAQDWGLGGTGQPVRWLTGDKEIIWASEKDGWRHLYLVDSKTGETKQITKGDWVMRGVDRIDEEKRQIWFRASGRNREQDPYLIHFYRINFDGTGMVALTAGHGNHAITYSPDEKYIIDTYGRVDLAPITELRRVADGQLVCDLEEADTTELKASEGYSPVEVFSAKGRDNETDIWGIIFRPANFDPQKKYPVIESIYAGPHGSHVPKTFGSAQRQEIANQGYIVVQIDGMGTANRSKKFHDMCWQNIKDAGFPDRIKWMQAAAARYPYIDITRVGIYGTSAGGQNAMAALLFHPDFYDAAVANCGCHDNRMDKSSWNEQWMGYPLGQHYSDSSNVDNAWRLQGKLMLVLGELDTNVPPESTMRVCNALIQAGRDFDFYNVPNADHGAAAPNGYNGRRQRDFFAKSLQGIEPPNRNLTPGEPPTPGRGGRRGRGAAAAAIDGTSAAAQVAAPFVEEAAVEEAAQPATATASSQQQQPAAEAQSNAAPTPQPLVLTGLERRETRTSSVVDRFRADRGGLTRFYLAPEAPNTRARLRRFYIDWLAALTALPANTFNEREQEDISGLKTEIAEHYTQLEGQSKADAELDQLLPFAPTIYQLIEDRQAVRPMDAQSAAGKVDSVAGKIADARILVKAKLEGAPGSPQGPQLTADMLRRASARTGQLRQQLSRWHAFYDGYDPLFSWWMKGPYADAAKALEEYGTYLTEQSAKMSDATAPAPGPQPTTPDPNAIASLIAGTPSSGDVPDLIELVNEKHGYMELVLERYQAESGGGRGGRGGRGGGRGGRGRGGERGGDAQDGNNDNANAGERDGQRGGERAAAGDGKQDADQPGAEGDGGRGERRGRGQGRRGGRGGQGGDSPEAREAARLRATRWLDGLKQLDFDKMSRADKVDYLMLKVSLDRQIADATRPRDAEGDGDGGGRGGRGGAQVLDESGMRVIPPAGREALMSALEREMIDYTPEQLIELGKREMAWCRAEIIKASREMGLGDDWMAAVERVKNMHVRPGEQPQMIQGLAWEAINYLREHDLITIPNVASEIFGMQMMSPQRQLVNPFFTGGGSISVSYPTDTMSHLAKLQSMKGNNIPFARATVHHELIPGHNMQGFMRSRYNGHRNYGTPFWGEGWALYWELQLYERGFPKTPEDRVGFLVWRSHRCARIVFSLSYQMGQMMPQQCVDYLVANVGFERKNSEAEVLRSFNGSYAPLYQAAYLLGGIQLKQLHTDVVKGGKMPEKEFHNTIIRGGPMPIKMVRLLVEDVAVTREKPPQWLFYGPIDVPNAAAGTPTP